MDAHYFFLVTSYLYGAEKTVYIDIFQKKERRKISCLFSESTMLSVYDLNILNDFNGIIEMGFEIVQR